MHLDLSNNKYQPTSFFSGTLLSRTCQFLLVCMKGKGISLTYAAHTQLASTQGRQTYEYSHQNQKAISDKSIVITTTLY